MSPPAPRLLLLSNGHGEDLSGAMLAQSLLSRGLQVDALPLVGHGHAYRRAKVPVLGTTREYSTGGLGYTSLLGRLQDLREGQPLYVLSKLLLLWRRRHRYHLVVAIGDLVPVVACWACRVPSVVYLVAYSSHYEGKLRLPWPCGWMLRSRPVQGIWSRDELTAIDLSQQLGRQVLFLGNPFLDPVWTSNRQPLPGGDASTLAGTDQPPPEPWQRRDRLGAAAPAASLDSHAGGDRGLPAGLPSTATPPLVALLPGSRLPEALLNLGLMLRVLTRLSPPWRESGGVRLQAALVRDLTRSQVMAMADPLGWTADPGGAPEGDPPATSSDPMDSPLILRHRELRLELHWGRFHSILAQAELVLAMAGTASEQAVGLGKAVIQLAGPGPQFTAGFAEAQRRLLGPGVVCADGAWGSRDSLNGTAQLIDDLLRRSRSGATAAAWHRQLDSIAMERIGPPGGTERMAEAILEHLRPAPGLP